MLINIGICLPTFNKLSIIFEEPLFLDYYLAAFCDFRRCMLGGLGLSELGHPDISLLALSGCPKSPGRGLSGWQHRCVESDLTYRYSQQDQIIGPTTPH